VLLEREYLRNRSFRYVGQLFGVSWQALRRHCINHLGRPLEELIQEEDEKNAAEAPARMEKYRARFPAQLPATPAEVVEIFDPEETQSLEDLQRCPGDQRTLLEELEKLRRAAWVLLEAAIRSGSTRRYGAPVRYIQELRELLELRRQIVGGENREHEQEIDFTCTPEWAEFRGS